MERRQYLGGLGAVVATGSLAGCAGSGSGTDGDITDGENDERTGDDGVETNQYGFLSTSVTDQPNDIGDFESLVVTLDGIWVKPGDTSEDGSDDGGTVAGGDEDDGGTVAGGDEDDGGTVAGGDEDDEDDGEDGGRYYIEFDEPQEADLVQLQGEETELIDETELETGEYQFLQLDVREANGVLESNGEDAVVETPGNAPLKFNQAFEIRAGERTRFIADFAPFQRGNGEYLVRPVAGGTQVIYDDGGETETDTTDTDTDTTDTDTDTTDTDTDTTDTDTDTDANSTDSGGTTESGTDAADSKN